MNKIRVAAVTMQRNEIHCLTPWAVYHGYQFGFENLFILDHGSNHPAVVAELERLASSGVTVRQLPAGADFKDKGLLVQEEINRIERTGYFDFVFPIDCDELLVCQDEAGLPSCSRNLIDEHLGQLLDFEGVFEININFLHILGHPGYFWPKPYQKIFFGRGGCLTLDHGFHHGTACRGAGARASRLGYVHFHFKPFRINRELSLQKLKPWVDVNDLEAIRTFDGPGVHLKTHILCSEEEYNALFRLDHDVIFFDELNSLFRLLNLDPDFSNVDAPDASPKARRKDVSEGLSPSKVFTDSENEKPIWEADAERPAPIEGGGLPASRSTFNFNRALIKYPREAAHHQNLSARNMTTLGIAVTTYNRRELVIELCARLRQLTQTPLRLVICDDGSSDGTVAALCARGETVIGGRNGGVVRNKNRGIWYLTALTAADVILLLDDDVFPEKSGWDLEWVEAALRYGHINYTIPGRANVVSGEGTVASPIVSKDLSGPVICFRRDVLGAIGYFDPRFKRYGNEHTELTSRAIGAGYGGILCPGGGMLFYGIHGGISIVPCTGNGTPEDIEESSRIWSSMTEAGTFRHPWRDVDERAQFLSEVHPLSIPTRTEGEKPEVKPS